MFKAWVCIIIGLSGYNSSNPTPSVIADIARQSDCERVGRIAVSAMQSDGGSATFRCVQIMHTPE